MQTPDPSLLVVSDHVALPEADRPDGRTLAARCDGKSVTRVGEHLALTDIDSDRVAQDGPLPRRRSFTTDSISGV